MTVPSYCLNGLTFYKFWLCYCNSQIKHSYDSHTGLIPIISKAEQNDLNRYAII